MADYFVDHGAYSAQGVIGAANPTTWGVPQEGDGSATTAASAASTAFASFSAAPSSGTFSCCGVTISTTGVIGAASADAAANALASNINATTTAVASGVAGGLPALKNLVFARGPSGGAPAGTCQVMMRVGSAALNYANNTNCLLATTFNNETSAAGDKQFSGGSGGCWGWFINDVTVGGASATFAAGAFGVLSPAKPFVSVASGSPNALAEPGINEVIYGRSGSGKTITLPANTSIACTSAMHVHFVLDTNTKWTGDSGTGLVTISVAVSSSTSAGLSMSVTTHAKTIGSIGKHKLRVYLRSGTTTGYYFIATGNGSGYIQNKLWNVLFEEAADISVASIGFYLLASGSFHHFYALGCKFIYATPRSTWPQGAFGLLGLTGTLGFDGCEWECNFTALTDPGPLFTGTYAAAAAGVRLSACSITGWTNGKIKPFNITSGAANGLTIVENCTGFRIDSGTYLGFQAQKFTDEFVGRFVFQSAEVGLTFRDEHSRGVCDWIYGANYPTLRATQPDGTVWSVKMDWLTTAGIVGESLPFRSIPFTQVFREAAATKTVTLECYVPDSLTLNPTDATMRVSYVSDTTGKIVEQITKGVASAYAASSVSWTTNGLASYSAKKFRITTSEPIKQHTNVTVYLEFHRPAPTSNRQIYVDPEFALT